MKTLHNMWAGKTLSTSFGLICCSFWAHQDRMWWEESNFLPQIFKFSEIDLSSSLLFSLCFYLSPLQLFRPDPPPSEGPQYVNKAFSAYRGIYIEKEDLQMELNKLVRRP